jgi:hypothetical protein
VSATDPKGGESLVDYPRDCYPDRTRLRLLEEHDLALYEHANARWQRRLQALLPVVNPGPCDFPGCVE